MKKLTFACLAILGAAVIAPSVKAAPFNQDDLLLGFHATGGVGGDQTYVFNLGSTVSFRDNGNQGFIFNIGVDLSSIFGANWFTRTDLYWGAAGATSAAPSGVFMGDPSRTAYVSRDATGVGQSTPWTGFTPASLGTGTNDIKSFQTSFSDPTSLPTANSGGRGIQYADGAPNSWEFWNPQPGGPSFTIFAGSIEGAFGTGQPLAYLDLYRILNRTTGASPSGPVGTGTLETTFTIDAAGNISAVPEPSTVALFGLAGLGAVVAAWKKRRANS